MTTKEPAWKKFLKLKADVPISTANIADDAQSTTLKRKREALPPQDQKQRSIVKKTGPSAATLAEKKTKANKQKKKAKTKVKRSKKDEADSKAAQSTALQYLSLYCSARGEWKFSKPRQNYLLKHSYEDDLIDDDRFPNLLVYLKGLQGASRDRCLDTARDLISRYERQKEQIDDDAVQGTEKDEEGRQEQEEVTEEQMERAKKVLSALSEAGQDHKGTDSGESE